MASRLRKTTPLADSSRRTTRAASRLSEIDMNGLDNDDDLANGIGSPAKLSARDSKAFGTALASAPPDEPGMDGNGAESIFSRLANENRQLHRPGLRPGARQASEALSDVSQASARPVKAPSSKAKRGLLGSITETTDRSPDPPRARARRDPAVRPDSSDDDISDVLTDATYSQVDAISKNARAILSRSMFRNGSASISVTREETRRKAQPKPPLLDDTLQRSTPRDQQLRPGEPASTATSFQSISIPVDFSNAATGGPNHVPPLEADGNLRDGQGRQPALTQHEERAEFDSQRLNRFWQHRWLKTLGFWIAALLIPSLIAYIAGGFDTEFAHDLKTRFLSAMPDVDFVYEGPNKSLSKLVKQVELFNGAHERELEQAKSDIKDLQRFLPASLSVDYDGAEYHIPAPFWRALEARLQDRFDHEAQWNAFMQHNQATMDRMIGETSLRATTEWLDGKRIVTTEHFAELVRRELGMEPVSIDREIQNLKEKLDWLEKKRMDRIMENISSQIQHRLAMLPDMKDLQTLVAHNMVRNTQLALGVVNFFAPSNGAVVDPHLSSPTRENPHNNIFARAYLKLKYGRAVNPPITALQPWYEPGHCWCGAESAPGSRGTRDASKLQLAVLMAYRVAPSSVTVEHHPRDGVLQKQHAPAAMDVWAEIEDAQELALARELSSDFFAGRPQPSEKELARAGIPRNYVLLGEFSYDWSPAANHVQNFALQVDLAAIGVRTRKVIVRALTNHGGTYTCLYRVRLHGSPGDGVEA